jgi:general nucleoside transport system ATP-binding protein
MPAPRMALEGITRRYGTVTALDNASCVINAGEVHALLGENGAGKSTLMKIAFGLEQPDAGTVRIAGVPTILRSPRAAMAHGIGMVQQHFALVDAMTVAENVQLGAAGSFDLSATSAQVQRISAEAGLPLDPDARVSTLSVGAQQRLEIIKALARNSTTLILDEPTAVLAPGETSELLRWIRRFADGGGSVVLIAHKLREVLSVADRVTVLRRGATVFTAHADEVTEHTLAAAMLGPAAHRAPAVADAVARPSPGKAVITLAHVAARDEQGRERLRDASLHVSAGELLGIAAVEGAGQRELLRVIAGRANALRGTLHLPRHVGFVPEDRHRDAVVLDATLTENVALRGAGRRRRLMPWTSLRDDTAALMRARDVRATSPEVVMRTVSGGNQQKLVLARELAESPAALVVENPTRGLDIRATEAVHGALRAARDEGTAVVLYSSDLDEVLALADRVVVVTAGVTHEVARDRELIGRVMLAGAE